MQADRFRTFTEAAINLFERLKYFLDLDDDIVILAHSMGGMLILKILFEAKYFKNQNEALYEKIRNLRIVFVQAPLSVYDEVLATMNLMKYGFFIIQIVYAYTFVYLFTPILVFLKKIVFWIRKPFRKTGNFFLSLITFIVFPLTTLVNFILNQALIMNAFLGTKPHEFFNLVAYYRQYRDFTLSGFFQDKEKNKFERAVEAMEEDKFANFDKTNAANYIFTAGEPDFFCELELTKAFTEELGARMLYLPMNMHNPQHMFWNQQKINDLVLE